MFGYLVHIITLTAIYIMVVLAYAIPVGYTGMVHFGHVGLLAVGAYAAAILTTKGVSFWIAIFLAAILTGAVGFLVAFPGRKIKGEYFVLITLGFLLVSNAVLLNWTSVTSGPFGISGIRRPAGFGDPVSYLLLVLGFLALAAILVRRVVASPFGRALEAVRDDDLAAESLGKPTAKLRITGSVFSAVLVGIAGALLAHFIRFINPQVFWLDNAVFVLAALVVGGLASFRGAIAGTVLLFALLESVRFLPISAALVGPLRLILFSGMLLLVVLYRPKGLLGRAQLE